MDLIHHPRDADLLGRQCLYLSAAVSAWELAVHDGIKRVYHYLAKFSGGGLTNIQVVHLFWQQMRCATPGATLPQAHYKSGHTCLSYGSTSWVQIAGFSAADNTKMCYFHPKPASCTAAPLQAQNCEFFGARCYWRSWAGLAPASGSLAPSTTAGAICLPLSRISEAPAHATYGSVGYATP